MTEPKRDPEENADKAASENVRAAEGSQDAPKAERRGGTQKGSSGAQKAADEAPKRKAKPKSAPHVVGTGERDDVYLRALIFENKLARKSLSVHHLQRRLIELGYGEAGGDLDGYYGPATRDAVARFQADEDIATGQGLEGLMNADTLRSIFENDSNVHLILN